METPVYATLRSRPAAPSENDRLEILKPEVFHG
jgi:hypothetical protein